MRDLAILNLATTDEGGAGKATIAFTELFAHCGYRSALVVKESKLNNPKVTPIINYSNVYSPTYWINKIKNKLAIEVEKIRIGALDAKYCMYNTKEHNVHISADEILSVIDFVPDIIVLHWVTNFANIKTINELVDKTKASIYWLMMDNSPLTGGCHYPWDCEGYINSCSDCPAVLTVDKKHLVAQNYSLKRAYLPSNMHLIAFSESDFQRAKKSSLFGSKNVHRMLFPVDKAKFTLGDKVQAKSFFGIAAHQFVIFYGAISLGNVRKGGEFFIDALRGLEEELFRRGLDPNNCTVLLAGNNEAELFNNLSVRIVMCGYLTEDNLVMAYQAADVFVSTSLEDSGPTMINQALMCGVPVVAFEVGVACDLIATGVSGYKVKTVNSQALLDGIVSIMSISPSEYNVMRETCRRIAEDMYSYESSKRQINEIFKLC